MSLLLSKLKTRPKDKARTGILLQAPMIITMIVQHLIPTIRTMGIATKTRTMTIKIEITTDIRLPDLTASIIIAVTIEHRLLAQEDRTTTEARLLDMVRTTAKTGTMTGEIGTTTKTTDTTMGEEAAHNTEAKTTEETDQDIEETIEIDQAIVTTTTDPGMEEWIIGNCNSLKMWSKHSKTKSCMLMHLQPKVSGMMDINH
jgi:hypothetical protein